METIPKSGTVEYTRYWRKRNPKKRYAQKQSERSRYNDGLLPTAVCRHKRWTKDEIAYLREYSKTKTARELAYDLNRTYLGVMMKAFFCDITLITEDKRHMRLVTVNPKGGF
jgi:hypothetical protein